MKLCLIFLLAFVASISGAPQEASEASASTKSSDEVAMEDIDSMLASYAQQYKSPAPFRVNKRTDILGDIILPSVDKQCALAEYKKHDLVDKINKDKLKTMVDVGLAHWSFLAVALPCTSKFSALLEFFFENAMTLNIVWNAIKDDAQFAPVNEVLTCANSYAVKNNYLDLEEFRVAHEVTDENKSNCDAMIHDFEGMKNMAQSAILDYVGTAANSACYKELINQTEAFGVKNLLLVQIRLKDKQRHREQRNFEKDFREIAGKLLTCIAIPAVAANEV